MKLLGNIIWFLLGGIVLGFSWITIGIFYCATIIGIPWGIQCFKIAGFIIWPFGKQIEYGGGSLSLLANIIWVLVGGITLALESVLLGCLFCITIIGIPLGKQCFKYAKLALMPFGTRIR